MFRGPEDIWVGRTIEVYDSFPRNVFRSVEKCTPSRFCLWGCLTDEGALEDRSTGFLCAVPGFTSALPVTEEKTDFFSIT